MTRYLKQVNVRRYGSQVDRQVGPFGVGLNVVYGPNEAGKTTVASLVEGVLFGWEQAHGVRNRYTPEQGGRAGELVWVDAATGAECVLARTEAGATGDTFALEDIDNDTFDTLFSLSADELRSLRGSPDVVARLLSASSGTGSDPASAFVEVERRIAATPVYRLSAELEEKREQVKAATEQVQLYVQEDRELRELVVNRDLAAARITDADDELEALVARHAELVSADARAERLSKDHARLRQELESLSEQDAHQSCAVNARLLNLDSAGERVLFNRLDELAEEQGKLDRALDTAKENSATSTAAYEALCEIDDEEAADSRRLRNRPWQAIMAVLLPMVFVVAGVPVFVHGRQINSLSITALGVGLVVAAIFLAVAAVVVLFRQPRESAGLESRRKDAQWVMLQDKKKLDACQADREEFAQRVRSIFEVEGLHQAEGSIRQARALLEEARARRAELAENTQRVSSLSLRIRAAENELAEIDETRRSLAGLAGLVPLRDDSAMVNVPTGRKPLTVAYEALIREKTQQRDALLAAANDMSERFGVLTRELELARADRTVDQLRMEYQLTRAQLREAKHELITLLLARRVLERSIATWEVQGQPEVYARAGRLLETITGGMWVGVSTSQTGSLVAVNASGATRDPRHLSLGTCQQLYLALRLALLMSAETVGRSVPVLADDILVNFDADRRQGAAQALAELAECRQVIVFTCHRETAAALQAAAPTLTRIDL